MASDFRLAVANRKAWSGREGRGSRRQRVPPRIHGVTWPRWAWPSTEGPCSPAAAGAPRSFPPRAPGALPGRDAVAVLGGWSRVTCSPVRFPHILAFVNSFFVSKSRLCNRMSRVLLPVEILSSRAPPPSPSPTSRSPPLLYFPPELHTGLGSLSVAISQDDGL